MHCICFFLEVFMYYWIISMMCTELFLGWLAYYAHMTMDMSVVYCYLVLLTINGLMGVFSIFSVGGWFMLYIGQECAYAAAVYFLYLKIMQFREHKKDAKKEGKEGKSEKKPTGD